MLYFIGLILMAIGGIMLVPVPIAVILNEFHLISSFVIPALISLVMGLIIWKKFERVELTFGKAMVLAALGWLLLAFFGSLPYISSVNFGFIDAYFESMSGFTATGLTMFEMTGPGYIDAPRTVLLWRSFTQWIGGIGVIVLFLSTILGVGKVAKRLYAVEGGGGRVGPDKRQQLEPSVRSAAKSVWKIYGLYTILAALAMYLVGMPIFEAVNHSLTGLATGGFSVTADSFASYGSLILMITLFPMIAGATSFAVHRRVIGGDWKAFFKNVELKLMIGIIIIAVLTLMWTWGPLTALFQSISAITGTGFSSTNIIEGPDFAKAVLVPLMVIGGGFGSTSSAIKLIRTVVLIGALYWFIKRSFMPDRAVVPLKISGSIYSENEVLQMVIYGFIYVVALVIGSIITMILMPEAGAMNAIFDSASAQGNVGLSTGITGGLMPSVVKVTYIIQMWIGRLEIIPVIAFISYLIGKIPRLDKAV